MLGNKNIYVVYRDISLKSILNRYVVLIFCDCYLLNIFFSYSPLPIINIDEDFICIYTWTWYYIYYMKKATYNIYLP